MSSKENKKVIEHMNQTVNRFYSIEDERLGMKHFRYVMDDYFAADESIKCCGSVKPVSADGVYALWVTTENSDPKKRILYLHGGGYVIGFDGYKSSRRSSLNKIYTMPDIISLFLGSPVR